MERVPESEVAGSETVRKMPTDEEMRAMEVRYGPVIHRAVVGGGFDGEFPGLSFEDVIALLGILMFSPRYRPRSPISAVVRGTVRRCVPFGCCIFTDAVRDDPRYFQMREVLIRNLRDEIWRRLAGIGIRA